MRATWFLACAVGVASACSTAPDAPDAPDSPADEPFGQAAEPEAAAPGRAAAPTSAPTSPVATPTSPVAAPAETTGGPVGDWRAGDYPPDLKRATYLTLRNVAGQPGKVREYKVHVPKRYDPTVPTPMLFALHGLMQNAVMFVVNASGFVEKSDQEGFILVMPNGVQEEAIGGSWNAGACCGAAAKQKLDDVAFIRALYAELRTHLNVDARRVYATGMSNGGFMSHRLGCEAADLFAAIAPVAGSIGTNELAAARTTDDSDLKACTPSRPLPVLAIHGSSDGIVAYKGLKSSLDHWAAKDGCSATTRPAMQPASGGDTTCVTYDGCPSGVEVTGCSVQGGGHCWFGDPSCGTGAAGIGNLFVGNDSKFLKATDAIWAFLSRFQR